jgi:triacylglycerol lipase
MAVKDMSYRERGLLLSMFAHQCYCEPKKLLESRPGIKDLAPLKKFLNKPLPPTYIDVEGAQAYVMSDKDDVLIACRGTEPTALNDVVADLKMFPVEHHLGGRVHRGFYDEYEKVMPGIYDALKKHDKKQTKTLWITGHSLGGAMAVLVAAELNTCPLGVSGGLHTFGQPRVGNKEFLKCLEGMKYYRYRNNNDLVTAVPPSWLFFRHGGVLRYINTYGNIRKATWLQRFKDKCRGHWQALKSFNLIDGFADHSMGKYHEFLYNMDDNGEQLPK